MDNQNTSLSFRGQSLATNPARIDFEIFAEAMQNLYCPSYNLSGAFPLNIAENAVSIDKMKGKLDTILQSNDIPEWVMKYTGLAGHESVLEVLADTMSRHLCGCQIDPAHIALSAGASAVIEVSSFVLGDHGDVVVIPAPSYPMYTKDMGTKSGIERYDLQTHHNIQDIADRAPVEISHLENAWNDIKTSGKRFRFLLLTSPDNPTGCMYSKMQLATLADWCTSHQVHMIVNEIYGLSLIDTEHPDISEDYSTHTKFSSFAQIIQERQSDYLHMWYAFSKDFSMSGLRFGVMHSRNDAFLTAYQNANIPHLVSNLTQWLVSEMLQDKEFVGEYLTHNHIALNKSYRLLISALKKSNVPYTPSRGSLFVWIDLSARLSSQTAKAEEELWLDVYERTGILLTPGQGFQHSKFGLFRVVFTAVPYAHLKVAIDRLSKYLS